MHHELWFTAFLNHYFPWPAEGINLLTRVPFEHGHAWTNYMAMQFLVVLLLMIVAAVVRSSLSVDKPGKLQLMFENVYTFLQTQASDIIGHGWQGYVPFFATLFIFILTMNLLGVVPTFEAPTMFYYVPAGLAIGVLFYYNAQGVKVQGVVGHLKHFAGPLVWLAWFMFPLEIFSHLVRPVSLTIRLYANMFAGEEVTLSFLGLIPYLIPIAVVGLHVFVSFVQAFIFTMLTMVYVGEAVAHEQH
jgi:F-type H+-transporting ATPase subunit a